MKKRCPTLLEHYAIEARLNGLLGAIAYDAVFPGFRVASVIDGVALIWARNEAVAAEMESRHGDLMIAVLREMLDPPIDRINVLPARFPFYA